MDPFPGLDLRADYQQDPVARQKPALVQLAQISRPQHIPDLFCHQWAAGIYYAYYIQAFTGGGFK
jgi:hypothetical protein